MHIRSHVMLIVVIISLVHYAMNMPILVSCDTHVEGHIWQDTTWTLTDSPFVVVKDMVIDSGATLFIEPGVEVRFGGNFSMTVEGRIVAVGTEERPIVFTSNKLAPNPGDWETISFRSPQESRLEYCIIEYAVVGISVGNGHASIVNSEIHYNLNSGVYLTGDNAVVMTGNRLESNRYGVLVNGTSSGATIQNNYIYLNSEKGIYLYGNGSIQNVLVLNNRFSTNDVAIHVFGQVSTNITQNSISYNELGLLYENATDPTPVHYNDFYGNTLSARTNASSNVDVERNYWGDAKGPYHESLNPAGEGNPIESNGTNLDFIPFLTINSSYINQRPIADLLTDKVLVAPNSDITFIGTLSMDDRQVYRYFFDFGDGKNSGWTTLSIFTHRYAIKGNYSATLRVMDDFGAINENIDTIVIRVRNLPSIEVHLLLDNEAVKSGDSVSITVQVQDGGNPVDFAQISLLSLGGGSFNPISGFTDVNGHFSSTFISPIVTLMDDVRIIVTASKEGYVDGSDHKYLRVFPPLAVQITSESSVIESGRTTHIVVSTTYNNWPIDDVFVQIDFDVNGSITRDYGYTDLYGSVAFPFVAPQTLSKINVTIEAFASKAGYLSGSSQSQIVISPRRLDMNITFDPRIVLSGNASIITVFVTHNGSPVPEEAYVDLKFSAVENISEVSGFTRDGVVVFVFTSFLTSEPSTVNITATASMNWYISAITTTSILIVPKTFALSVTTTPESVFSGENSTIAVNVASSGQKVSNAKVTLNCEEGRFDFVTKQTDAKGDARFIFTAPYVTEMKTININVVVMKNGYSTRNATVHITVDKADLVISLNATPSSIISERTSSVFVYVSYNERPVSNVNVSITAEDGKFDRKNGLTDADGYCGFLYTGPTTYIETSIIISVNATKLGYNSADQKTIVYISPEAAGQPFWASQMMIIVIAVAVILVALIVVLVKLKIIEFQQADEAEQ